MCILRFDTSLALADVCLCVCEVHTVNYSAYGLDILRTKTCGDHKLMVCDPQLCSPGTETTAST